VAVRGAAPSAGAVPPPLPALTGVGGNKPRRKSWRRCAPSVWGGFPQRPGRPQLPRRESDTGRGEARTAATLNKLIGAERAEISLGFFFSAGGNLGSATDPRVRVREA